MFLLGLSLDSYRRRDCVLGGVVLVVSFPNPLLFPLWTGCSLSLELGENNSTRINVCFWDKVALLRVFLFSKNAARNKV